MVDYLIGLGTVEELVLFIGFTNFDIARHNQAISNAIPKQVERRRAKHLADKQLQADLGYPIRSRHDAATYTIPVHRRRIAPTPRPPRPTCRNSTIYTRARLG